MRKAPGECCGVPDCSGSGGTGTGTGGTGTGGTGTGTGGTGTGTGGTGTGTGGTGTGTGTGSTGTQTGVLFFFISAKYTLIFLIQKIMHDFYFNTCPFRGSCSYIFQFPR